MADAPIKDILAILAMFVFAVLGVGTVYHELEGSITLLVKKLKARLQSKS